MKWLTYEFSLFRDVVRHPEDLATLVLKNREQREHLVKMGSLAKQRATKKKTVSGRRKRITKAKAPTKQLKALLKSLPPEVAKKLLEGKSNEG